jgi:hypothetical protein
VIAFSSVSAGLAAKQIGGGRRGVFVMSFSAVMDCLVELAYLLLFGVFAVDFWGSRLLFVSRSTIRIPHEASSSVE